MFAFPQHSLQSALLARRFESTLTDLLQQLESKLDMVQMFLEAYPALLDELENKGWDCLDLEQIPQAARIFSFLLLLDDENPAYHAAYADCCSRLKKYEDACHHYSRTQELAPDIADAYVCLAEHALMMRKPQLAQEHLEALCATSFFHSSHPLYGDVLQLQGWIQDWMTRLSPSLAA